MMSNFNYNLDDQIKKQIEARKITPTRDLWSEIESQTAKITPVKSKMNWFLAAACLLLMVSLSMVLIFNNDKIIEPQLAETPILPQNKTLEKTNIDEVIPIKSEKTENSKTEKIVSSEKILQQQKPLFPAKIKTLPQIETKEQIAPQIQETILSTANNFALQDSSAIPKKRKYVDASTLLFSVEHKDVIETTKDGSNVATIDLNSK